MTKKRSAFTSRSLPITWSSWQLFIAGSLAEYGIRKTAADASEQGYEVILIDQCTGTGDSRQQVRMEVMASSGCRRNDPRPA